MTDDDAERYGNLLRLIGHLHSQVRVAMVAANCAVVLSLVALLVAVAR
jgi:hypothetical protein